MERGSRAHFAEQLVGGVVMGIVDFAVDRRRDGSSPPRSPAAAAPPPRPHIGNRKPVVY